MKTLVWFVMALIVTLPGFANASDSVRVEARLTSEHDDPKEGVEEIVKKKLIVTLFGSPQLQSGRLTVKAKFYADDLTTDQLVVEKELEITAVPEKSWATVELPEVIFRYTPTHGKTTGSGRRSKTKRIPASGRRYHGWAVQVMDGDRQLGAAYSAMSLKPKP